MRHANGISAVLTPVPIPGCGNGSPCRLDDFAKLVERALDPDCHNDRARALVLGNHDARGVEASAQCSVSARQN